MSLGDNHNVRYEIAETHEEVVAMSRLMVRVWASIDNLKLYLGVSAALNAILLVIILFKVW